jgi:FAD/FMN-containing dehydrogenase
MDRHAAEVQKISLAIQHFSTKNEAYRINHGSTNSTRPQRDKGNVVDISALSNVLEVNRDNLTATVEPNVPMDRLVEATLAEGLIPPVVMEFPGITAGGGFAGTGGESSSFRHGFFDENVNWVEMVLGNGKVVCASPTERSDLFRGAAGAVGTLGTVTLLELRLIEAKKYVKATYYRTGSVDEAIAKVREQTGNPENDYVDGILYSTHHGVVITGCLADEKPASSSEVRFSGAWDPWFYLHAQERTRSAADSSPPVDYIPLAEYLFRYDRAGFWVARSGFTYLGFMPFNRLTRWLLDDLMHTRMLYRALHASGESTRFVAQDLALPYATASSFIDYAVQNLNIWPLWLCPLRRAAPPTFHPFTATPGLGDGVPEQGPEMLNVGLWGWGPADPDEFVAKNRDLEEKVRQLGGMKWLYAHTYYPEDEFWKVYDREWYQELRRKYHAGSLPTVYTKVKVDVEAGREELRKWRQSIKTHWPVGGVWGAWKALKSGDSRLHRDARWNKPTSEATTVKSTAVKS